MRFHERLTHAAFAQTKAGSLERMLWSRSSPIESIVASISAVLCLSSAIFTGGRVYNFKPPRAYCQVFQPGIKIVGEMW